MADKKIIDINDRRNWRDFFKGSGPVLFSLSKDCATWYQYLYSMWNGDDTGKFWAKKGEMPENEELAHISHAIMAAVYYRLSPKEAGNQDFVVPDPDAVEHFTGYINDNSEDGYFMSGLLAGLIIGRDIARQTSDFSKSTPFDSDFDEYVQRTDTE